MDEEDVRRCKTALAAVLAALERSYASEQLRQAVQRCNNDMLKRMHCVYPLLCRVQMDTLAAHGYPADTQGLVKFAQDVSALEKEDEEVERMSSQLRHICMPPVMAQSNTMSKIQC